MNKHPIIHVRSQSFFYLYKEPVSSNEGLYVFILRVKRPPPFFETKKVVGFLLKREMESKYWILSSDQRKQNY